MNHSSLDINNHHLPFEKVIETYGPGLLRFCISRLGYDQGQDAFQETMLAALIHYQDLRQPRAIKGWLFSIAHHKIIDIIRKQDRTQLLDEDTNDKALVFYDHQPSGIWSHVAKLPSKQREAIGLRYLADLSYKDISQVMNISPAAARRNVFEGQKQLKEILTIESST